MDSQTPHYHFGETVVGNTGLPVSAFSAYSLLRNCNYFLASQGQDVHSKPVMNSEFHLRPSIIQGEEKSLENGHTKTYLTSPSALFGYPPLHLHVVPEQLRDLRSRSPAALSPCPSIYGSSNSRRQRGEKKPIPDEQKDDKYFERRKRNNQAAKKSRDARKMREDQVALRATILEHENAILRAQVLSLREEASSLRQMLLQKKTLEITSRDTQMCLS